MNVLNQREVILFVKKATASPRQKVFLHYVSVEEIGGCIYLLPREWMGKLLS